MRGAALALLLSCAVPAAAQEPTLGPPLDCTLGKTCFIQQYVDHDPGPGARDFACNALSYDGHQGTDFALPSRAAMRAGVDVLAAAPGVVGGARDGMPDGDMTDIEGRDCGNGVRIDHADGWSTQYCHLQRGTVAVRAGDRVERGAVLGRVGQSGRAAFPHLHLGLRRDGVVVDPFAPDGPGSCTVPPARTLWQDPPTYRPGGLIALGLSDGIPGYDAVKDGTAAAQALAPGAPALVIWAYGFGFRQGDRLRLALKGPEGTVVDEDVPLDRAQAQAFRAVGKRRGAAPWPAGSYRGTAALVRGGTTIERRAIALTLR